MRARADLYKKGNGKRNLTQQRGAGGEQPDQKAASVTIQNGAKSINNATEKSLPNLGGEVKSRTKTKFDWAGQRAQR